ncbi:MAG: dTDP-4-dehydrorhamnose reductase [Microbacteriaceae bacterium]|nr:dTDP-4-dehydrorhamnose reductase [Microbacteriaceae bacterium]
MTRYLITGANGMLGRDLQRALADRDVTALGRADLDVTDADAVRDAVRGHDVVINAAAYTKVDDAETNEAMAASVNTTGAANLAMAVAEEDATLVQVSTDYVFDGSATTPYLEDAPLNPISAYGRTKADGERRVREWAGDRSYIIRTAWTYGAGGPNFAKTMVRLASSNDTVSVVNDQIGQPTWTRDLADQILALLDTGAPVGIYHGTNSGQGSWFDFAKAVFATAGLDPERVLATDSSQFLRPAPRPAYSVLGHDAWQRAGLAPMRHWSEALTAAAGDGVLEQG